MSAQADPDASNSDPQAGEPAGGEFADGAAGEFADGTAHVPAAATDAPQGPDADAPATPDAANASPSALAAAEQQGVPITSTPLGSGPPRPQPNAELAGKLPPTYLQPIYGYPEVVRFGYRFVLASKLERAFWGIGLIACVVVLCLATFALKPDPAGIGTHEQLGLPACGFVEMSGGYPCPSCGYTTTFTLAAHGRPIDAIVNQPFGFFVFCLTVLAVPITAFCAFGGVSLFAASERWPWPRVMAVLILCWLLAWGYKAAKLV